jgi:hypothetical protein
LCGVLSLLGDGCLSMSGISGPLGVSRHYAGVPRAFCAVTESGGFRESAKCDSR